VTVALTHPALSLTVAFPPDLPVDPALLWEGWPTGSGPAPCRLQLQHGGTPPTALAHAAPIAYGSLGGWATDDTLVLSGPKGGLVVDYTAAAGILALPEIDPDPAFARDTLWRLLTLELARTQGRYYLHGAAWSGPEGADVVCADGGTGKSTLAAAVLAAGAQVITDDGALLMPGDRPQVTALPTAWRLGQPAATWCGLPSRQDKQRYWPPAARQARPSPIGRLFFAERADHMALRPLSAGDVLPRLIRQNPLLMTSHHLAGRHIEALRQLAETVPAYRLLLGPEMLSDRRAALNLLGM
jgi:hypothetical protein